jgi:intracellular sulfur oxidation DsrE/DsrF family protein
MAAGLAVAVLAGAWLGPARGGAPERLKVVFHVNFADRERQVGALKNVANFLKAEPDAEIEVVCHAAGIGLVLQDQCPEVERVSGLLEGKVAFAACENTLREKQIDRGRLLPGVGTVPSGAVEVVRKQHEGFAYFKP